MTWEVQAEKMEEEEEEEEEERVRQEGYEKSVSMSEKSNTEIKQSDSSEGLVRREEVKQGCVGGRLLKLSQVVSLMLKKPPARDALLDMTKQYVDHFGKLLGKLFLVVMVHP
eukprot:759353-Hanusia_phi.AAC.2